MWGKTHILREDSERRRGVFVVWFRLRSKEVHRTRGYRCPSKKKKKEKPKQRTHKIKRTETETHSNKANMTETIALFGATGGTGKPFLAAALAAGYKVQAMVRTPSKVTATDGLTVIQGDFSNEQAIQKTIKGATFIVSLAGGPMQGKPKEYPKDLMLNFVQKLVAAAKKESSVKVLLYQAGAFSALPDGTLPMSMHIFRTVVGSWFMGLTPNFMDNEQVIKYISTQQEAISFKTIVTRPGGLSDSEGGKTLKASDDPETGFVAFKDVAAFTLKALTDESLYGTYPFVKIA